MASRGTRVAEVTKALEAAAKFLNNGNGGFRDLISNTHKARLVAPNDTSPLGLQRVVFDMAVRGQRVAGLGSETRREIARQVISLAGDEGVVLPVNKSTTATLGLA